MLMRRIPATSSVVSKGLSENCNVAGAFAGRADTPFRTAIGRTSGFDLLGMKRNEKDGEELAELKEKLGRGTSWILRPSSKCVRQSRRIAFDKIYSDHVFHAPKVGVSWFSHDNIARSESCKNWVGLRFWLDSGSPVF
jgi:hypothetical protein